MARSGQFRELVHKYENLQTVVKLREMVRRLWQVELSFADSAGKVIDPTRGRISPSINQFCHNCLFDSNGLKKCDVTVADIARRLRAGESPKGGVFLDCHLGFQYVAVPIWAEKNVLSGFILAGGFSTRTLDAEQKRDILARSRAFAGTSIQSTEKAFEEIPILHEQDVRFLLEVIRFGIEEVQEFHQETEKRVRKMQNYEAHLNEMESFRSIVGRAPSMRRMYQLLDKVRGSETTVLVQGENGTGKELVARAIHYHSERSHRRFVSQNCSAFHESLLDSELFGHVKGSFTGAIRDKKGLFEAADGGTFFMDEIGDMSGALQVKLLRVLQEGTFIPVGGTEARKVDVRVIAATNRDLRKMVDEGSFREDLYYRLNVIAIHVPPLRERREDVPLLVEFFLRKHGRSSALRQKRFSEEALETLMSHSWPGNVRQLENEVQRAMVFSGKSELITRDMLSPNLTSTFPQTIRKKTGAKFRDMMEQVERQILLDGLRRNHWNKSRLSRELGMSRATLIWKIQKYGLTPSSRA